MSTGTSVAEGFPELPDLDGRPASAPRVPENPARRALLVAGTSALGGIGLAAASLPFVASLLPSERAKAAGAPVEVDIGRIEEGMLLTVEWRGRPVWILRRTPDMLRLLPGGEARLNDPESSASQQPGYCRNATRSIRPEVFVCVGICTHLGCVPSYRPETAPADLGRNWRGGFYCPCHGSTFDLAGRVFRNVPAPTNLVIPRHRYMTPSRLLIGKDDET